MESCSHRRALSWIEEEAEGHAPLRAASPLHRTCRLPPPSLSPPRLLPLCLLPLPQRRLPRLRPSPLPPASRKLPPVSRCPRPLPVPPHPALQRALWNRRRPMPLRRLPTQRRWWRTTPPLSSPPPPRVCVHRASVPDLAASSPLLKSRSMASAPSAHRAPRPGMQHRSRLPTPRLPPAPPLPPLAHHPLHPPALSPLFPRPRLSLLRLPHRPTLSLLFLHPCSLLLRRIPPSSRRHRSRSRLPALARISPSAHSADTSSSPSPWIIAAASAANAGR
jgi:hypothetical protein